jgi:putative ABC transport system substrate-binding protein
LPAKGFLELNQREEAMGRREVIVGLSATLAATAAFAQNATTKRVIGVVMGANNDPAGAERVRRFEDGLRSLGWLPGKDVIIECRWAAGDENLARVHALELIALKPDVILADGTPVTIVFRDSTSTIPIVFVQVSDPLGSRIVSSLARPGANITGFTNFEFSMGGKWIDIIREIKPTVRRVGVVYNAQTAPFGTRYVQAINEAARAANLGVEVALVAELAAVDKFINSLSSKDDALIVLPDVFNVTHHKSIIAVSEKCRLLALYPFAFMVAAGGIVSYGIDQLDMFGQSASYVDRILRGEAPASLPVQQPTKFLLDVNLKSASAQGISIPPQLLARADKVIE